MNELEERIELAFDRIEEIKLEKEISEPFCTYFNTVASFIMMLKKPIATAEYNKKLYDDILDEKYDQSYGNPDFITSVFEKCGVDNYKEYAKILCYLYAEMRALIPYAYENNTEILTIYLELFIEIYVMFSNDVEMLPKVQELKEVIYWFNSDNSDITVSRRLLEQLDPTLDFASKIITESDLSNPSYLYKFGEYISDNEIEVSKFLANLSEEEINSMATTFTEGYRIGFVKAGKPLHKKTTAEVRYCLGFERVVKKAFENLSEIGLKPAMMRAATLSIHKKGVHKIGYYGAIPNKQYEYDHREDYALYLNKDFVNRKADVTKNFFEENKEKAAKYAGPAVMEVFGENPFSPVSKNTAITLDVVGQKLAVEQIDRLSQITTQYIKGEERSFTIIAYPIPEIGPDFPAIFRDTVKLNTLDYKRYEAMQQHIIDALDGSTEIRIEGKGTNKTNLTVKTQYITDATKQTVFENCVADVNIPVGEVFTSPVLKGTNGVLNVSQVYLNELNYEDLTIVFKDGMIDRYSCSNFQSKEENEKYIKDNILFHHETLPIGEFAIGTNTTAYRMARDYHIEEKLPILIGEKTGPHFAVGDTCYSHEEDVKVYNPDGKEIIARDNEITAMYRKTDPSKAYFNCHTDITIPYDELKGIYAVYPDGSEKAIIEDGLFVLDGLDELNIPLK